MSLNVGALAPVGNSTAVVAMHLEGGGQGDSLKQMVELLAQQVLALQQQSTNQARVFMTEKHAFTQQLYEQAEKTRAVQEQVMNLQTQLTNEQTARQAAEQQRDKFNAQVQKLKAELQQEKTLCSKQQRELQTKQAHQSDHKDDMTCIENRWGTTLALAIGVFRRLRNLKRSTRAQPRGICSDLMLRKSPCLSISISPFARPCAYFAAAPWCSTG